MAEILPQRLSSLHRRHISLGARMVAENGWQRPACYTSAQEEAASVQQAVGLCDISPIGKLLVQGDDIGKLPGDAALVTEVPGTRAVARGTTGTLVCRLATDQLLILVSSGASSVARAALESPGNSCVHIVDMTSALTALCLTGPHSQEVLSKLTDIDLSAPSNANMTCAQANLSGVQAILVRADFSDMPAYRILVSRDLGEFAWDVLTEAGSREGIVPFGVDALRLLQGEI